MIIVSINKILAMIDISRRPKLEFGGAPTPTKIVLKIKTIEYIAHQVETVKINFTNKDNWTLHKIHHWVLQKTH